MGSVDDQAVLLGHAQQEWLIAALRHSRALWKVIASPLPIAHIGRGARVVPIRGSEV